MIVLQSARACTISTNGSRRLQDETRLDSSECDAGKKVIAV